MSLVFCRINKRLICRRDTARQRCITVDVKKIL